MSSPQHQGKFHLLSILLIPALLVSFFLSDSWIPGIVTSVISVVLLYLIFRKKP
jgi:hypothetical protein